MTTIEELISRVSQLEETVSHLSTHHDERYLVVHDDVSADTCNRLFNVKLRQAQRSPKSRVQQTKGKGIKRRTA